MKMKKKDIERNYKHDDFVNEYIDTKAFYSPF